MYLSVAHDSQYQLTPCSRVLLEVLPVRRFIIVLVASCNMSCPVLSCPVLSSPVLSCPVLSCPVLSCPLLSCPLLSCPVLSSPLLSCPVLSCPVLSSPVLSCPVLSCTDKSSSLSPKYLFHIKYFNITIPCIWKSSNFSLSLSPSPPSPPLSLSPSPPLFEFPHQNLNATLFSVTSHPSEQTEGTVLKTAFT